MSTRKAGGGGMNDSRQHTQQRGGGSYLARHAEKKEHSASASRSASARRRSSQKQSAKTNRDHNHSTGSIHSKAPPNNSEAIGDSPFLPRPPSASQRRRSVPRRCSQGAQLKRPHGRDPVTDVQEDKHHQHSSYRDATKGRAGYDLGRGQTSAGEAEVLLDHHPLWGRHPDSQPTFAGERRHSRGGGMMRPRQTASDARGRSSRVSSASVSDSLDSLDDNRASTYTSTPESSTAVQSSHSNVMRQHKHSHQLFGQKMDKVTVSRTRHVVDMNYQQHSTDRHSTSGDPDAAANGDLHAVAPANPPTPQYQQNGYASQFSPGQDNGSWSRFGHPARRAYSEQYHTPTLSSPMSAIHGLSSPSRSRLRSMTLLTSAQNALKRASARVGVARQRSGSHAWSRHSGWSGDDSAPSGTGQLQPTHPGDASPLRPSRRPRRHAGSDLHYAAKGGTTMNEASLDEFIALEQELHKQDTVEDMRSQQRINHIKALEQQLAGQVGRLDRELRRRSRSLSGSTPSMAAWPK